MAPQNVLQATQVDLCLPFRVCAGRRCALSHAGRQVQVHFDAAEWHADEAATDAADLAEHGAVGVGTSHNSRICYVSVAFEIRDCIPATTVYQTHTTARPRTNQTAP